MKNVTLTREEIVLVLDAFHGCKGRISPEAPCIQELSALLRLLSIHPESVRGDPSFRPPKGVDRRVRNFSMIARGKTERVPETYLAVWEEFYGARQALTDEVKRIVSVYGRGKEGEQ